MGTMQAISTGFQAAQLVAGQRQANSAARAQAEQVAAQNAYLTQQQQIREKQQRDLLKRQVAATRAKLSAGGGGAGGGSGQALLAGMVKAGEGQLADDAALLQTRQNNSTIGLSSGDGLAQSLDTIQKSWNLLRPYVFKD